MVPLKADEWILFRIKQGGTAVSNRPYRGGFLFEIIVLGELCVKQMGFFQRSTLKQTSYFQGAVAVSYFLAPPKGGRGIS